MTTLAIVNANAGAGAAWERWQSIEALAHELFPDLKVIVTDNIDAIEDTCRSTFTETGDHTLIAVGGDGSNHYAVNNLMRLRTEMSTMTDVTFASLPLGTGNDFVSGVSAMPQDGTPEKKLRWLSQAKARHIDLMKLTYNGQTRYSVNITSMGLGYDVNERVNNANNKSQVTFLLATIQSIISYQPPKLRIAVDGNTWYDDDTYVLAIANGSRFGAGMQIAPTARADDGQLEVTLIEGYNRLNILNALSKVYGGEHVHLPKVQTTTGQVIEIETYGHNIGIDIDGETNMTDTMTVEVLPGILHARV